MKNFDRITNQKIKIWTTINAKQKEKTSYETIKFGGSINIILYQ